MYKEDCLKSDYTTLEKMFWEGGFGAIDYPAQVHLRSELAESIGCT